MNRRTPKGVAFSRHVAERQQRGESGTPRTISKLDEFTRNLALPQAG